MKTNYFEKKQLDEIKRQHEEASGKKGTFRVSADGEEEVDAHLAWLFEDRKIEVEDEDAIPAEEAMPDADDERTWLSEARQRMN